MDHACPGRRETSRNGTGAAERSIRDAESDVEATEHLNAMNALGVDYNIYLMSRIKEEARKSELPIAIRNALSHTGGVITSAGLILAGTFSALMVLPLQDIFQLGFAVAAGVIMDTFVTRTLIVPALVSLLGSRNWWPGSIRMVS